MDKFPVVYTDTQREEIEQFIRRNFGESEFTSHELESAYVHTDTALIAPEGQNRTFVTFGMGARKMNSPTDVSRIELVISASPAVDVTDKDGFLLAGEVTAISKYPFRENTWLQAGHTINASEDFKERFGYDFFAFWDLGLSFRPTGMNEEVHFIAPVPIYEEEREWIVNNDTFAFMRHLHDVYGDAMFCADQPREVCIPDWDEEEQEIQTMMRLLGLDEEEMTLLLERMAEADERDEEVTYEQLDAWIQELKNARSAQE